MMNRDFHPLHVAVAIVIFSVVTAVYLGSVFSPKFVALLLAVPVTAVLNVFSQALLESYRRKSAFFAGS
jgi:hypothetical protein